MIAALIALALSIDDPADLCEARMRDLGKSLVAIKAKQGEFPADLAGLAQAARCPARGRDYEYSLGDRPSGGLAIPAGPAPHSDLPGKPWGSERNVTLWLRSFYGDAVPIVRCLDHKDAAGHPVAVNLTLDGKVRTGGREWSSDPEAVAEFASRATRDLTADPAQFSGRWRLSGISDAVRDWDRAARSDTSSVPMGDLAEALLTRAERLPDPVDARRIAARLSLLLSDFLSSEAAARALLSVPGHEEEEEVRQVLAESLAGQGRFREAADVYAKMSARNPDSKNIRVNLADALEAAGEAARAATLREGLDPGRVLVGQKAPAFRVPTLDGREVSVDDLAQGKKAVLLNFWFRRCGPCREEFPALQKLYDELKGSGLEVLAIDGDDEEPAIRKFIGEERYTFPVGVGLREKEGRSIAELFRVETFPTNVIIDADGKIVLRRAGWDERAIRDALKALGIPSR